MTEGLSRLAKKWAARREEIIVKLAKKWFDDDEKMVRDEVSITLEPRNWDEVPEELRERYLSRIREAFLAAQNL